MSELELKSDELRQRMNTLPADTFGGSSPVDTKPLPMPTESEGKDWARYPLEMKAYLGAIDPKHDELSKTAGDPDRSLNHGDLGPGTTGTTDSHSSVSRCS